jgi:NAD(P)H dehydrogenase (quinone)
MIARGCQQISGHVVRVKSVDEATAADVLWADGLAVGSPTNLGGMSWKMKKFWDDFSTDNWSKVDGKICCTFSSQGGHAGGAELCNLTMGITLMNYGFLYFGVTDYVSKIHTLHYGACVAKAPRNDTDVKACERLGLRLAEWVAVFVDGRKSMHPQLTTKQAERDADAKLTEEAKIVNVGGSHCLVPVNVIVTKEVPVEAQAKWLEMAAECSAATLREEGCFTYKFVKKTEGTTRFVIVEEWASMAHLEAHFETPHFKRLVPQMDAISSTVSIDLCQDALANSNPAPTILETAEPTTTQTSSTSTSPSTSSWTAPAVLGILLAGACAAVLKKTRN